MTATHTSLRLLQAKLDNIILGENISRAGVEPTPRSVRDLADQIILNDYWEPPSVVVSPSKRAEHAQKYILVAGYRRIAAAKLLAQEGRLPAVAGDRNGVWVYLQNKTDAARDALNAAENIVRQNLSTYQTAHTLLYLHDKHGHTPKHLAESYGILPKTVSNYIRAARKLDPKIQHAWLNFEDSPKPIGINKLLEWAALPADEQIVQFESSAWATIYKIQADASDPKNSKPPTAGRTLTMRSRSELETAIALTGNLYHIEALEWVLRKRDTLDGERIASASRHDRGSSKRKRTDPSSASSEPYAGAELDESPTYATEYGTAGPPRDRSRQTPNRSSDSLRENERGKPNGTPNTS